LSDEKPYHYTLATSPVKKKIFASAFRTDEGHIIEDGLPRNDVLINSEIINLYTEEEEALLKEIKAFRQANKIINCYMPTFRKSEVKFFDVVDLKRLNDFLIQENMVFLIKLHPKSSLRERFAAIHFSNIITIDPDVDPYTFLNQVDILTTDYSSIYTDFMLLDRPVVGFYYDYELYSAQTRDCYFDFDEYMPEIKAKDMNELMAAIVSVKEKDSCRERRIKSRNVMFSKTDGKACGRIYERLLQILNTR
jgi:CDP-glycerol glycerophosphotransferase (TagB/SpsB family)